MASERSEQIIAASLHIDALRRQLAEAENRLEGLLSAKHTNNRAASRNKRAAIATDEDLAVVPANAANQDLSVTDRIIALVEANPGWDFSAPEILGLLPDVNLNSIRSALYRLAEDQRIARKSRGNFGSNG